MNWKVIIAIIFLTLLINVGIHQTIVNQSKEIRKSCLEYVQQECACKPERIINYKYQINNSENQTWNIPK